MLPLQLFFFPFVSLPAFNQRTITAMEANVEVSIIIPFYNGLDWLEMIFVALRKQTMRHFEVIVADDGSREEVVVKLKALIAEQPFPVVHLWQEDLGFRKNRMLNRAVVQSR